jgi:type I restriction enzyme S subunit
MIKPCMAECELSLQLERHSTIPALGDLRPNPDWARLSLFDRKDWTRVRFGDVVQNVNETERSPAEAGIERFIGLEHLEPGSLHVRAWGDVADGTTFTRSCRPGQVLFGKRRAYQRKVAVAEFDAVVSGDIYIFAPKDERLLLKLLPFLCMSERFFQHAVETSAGSLSPRTNWGSLTNFEFDLPPLDQQRRIAEILWAVDGAMLTACSLSEAIMQYQESQIREAMRTHVQVTDENQGAKPLGELFGERRETGFGNLRVLSVTIAGKIVPRDSLERNVIDKTGREKYFRVSPNDIAYNTMRMWQGSCGVVGEEGIISPAYTVLIPRTGKSDPIFWNYIFHTTQLREWFRRFSTGVAADRWRLYYKSFAKIPVRVPSLSLQIKFGNDFGSCP